MKPLIVFLSVMMLPIMAVCDGNLDFEFHPQVQEFKQDIEKNHIDKKTFKMDIKDPVVIAALYKRFAQDFPDEVETILDKNISDFERFARFTALYANTVYNDIKKEEIAKFEARSKATGRKIITKGSNEHIHKRLYRGDYLESEACNGMFGGYEDRLNNFESYVEQAKHTCLFPDGHEEYSMQIIENGNKYKSFNVLEDDKSKGISRSIIIDLDMNLTKNKDNYSNIFKYQSHVKPYDETLKLRNEEMKHIQDGILIAKGYCLGYPKDKRCKKYTNKEYKSSTLSVDYITSWMLDGRGQQN